jgi:hypothetical protein
MNAIREGFRDIVDIEIMHYQGDSAIIEFCGQPGFITSDNQCFRLAYEFYTLRQWFSG